MTPECQPLIVSVNKIIKDSIKFNFELSRLTFDNINPKLKLKTARLKMIENIYKCWKDDKIITKEIILNGFKHAGLTYNFYLSYDEYKLYDNYMYDIIDYGISDILDDLGQELNENENNDEESSDSDEENEKDDLGEKFKNEGNI